MDKKNVSLHEFLKNRVALLKLPVKNKTKDGISAPVTAFDMYSRTKGIQTVKDVTPEHAVEFFGNVKEKLSGTTLVRYRMYLKKVFKAISPNPFDEIPPFKAQKTPYSPFNAMQLRQIMQFLKENDPQLWLFARFIYSCLIRPNSELRLLKIKDIDFGRGTISVPAQIAKNGRFQTVIIPNALLKDIQHFKKYPSEYFLFSKKNEPGEKQVSMNYFYNRFKKVLNHLEFSERYQMYSLKSTGALDMLKAGATLKEVQKQGRWQSLDQMDTYLSAFGFDEMKRIRDFGN
jgi:integrase